MSKFIYIHLNSTKLCLNSFELLNRRFTFWLIADADCNHCIGQPPTRAWIWPKAWKSTRRIPGSLRKACSWRLPPCAPWTIHAQSTLSRPSQAAFVRQDVCAQRRDLRVVSAANPMLIIGDIHLLPNQMRLLLAGERKHPENIVQRVEKAASEYRNHFKCISCRSRIAAITKQFQNIGFWSFPHFALMPKQNKTIFKFQYIFFLSFSRFSVFWLLGICGNGRILVHKVRTSRG